VKNQSWLPRAIVGIIVVTGLIWAAVQNYYLEKLHQDIPEKWSLLEAAYQERNQFTADFLNALEGDKSHNLKTLDKLNQAATLTSQAGQTHVTPLGDLKNFCQIQSQVSALFSSGIWDDPHLQSWHRKFEVIDRKVSGKEILFNESVGEYNFYLDSYPQKLIAQIKGLQKKSFCGKSPHLERFEHHRPSFY
jgi:hypothetical protein